MRKYILALMVLSGVAAAQRFRVPILHRDPVDAQRAALHEKLTRFAETRNSLGMPEAQPGSTGELDALTASVSAKKNGRAKAASLPPQQAQNQHLPGSQAVGQPANAWPPPPQTWTQGDPQPSLGEVARKERARKHPAIPSNQQ